MISKGIDVCFDDWENAAQWTGERGWKKEEKHKCNTNRPPPFPEDSLSFFSPQKSSFFSSLAILAALFGDSFPLLVVTYFTHHISIELRIVWHQEKRGILPRNPCATFILLLFYGITNGQRNKYIAPRLIDFYKEIKWFKLWLVTHCTFWR